MMEWSGVDALLTLLRAIETRVGPSPAPELGREARRAWLREALARLEGGIPYGAARVLERVGGHWRVLLARESAIETVPQSWDDLLPPLITAARLFAVEKHGSSSGWLLVPLPVDDRQVVLVLSPGPSGAFVPEHLLAVERVAPRLAEGVLPPAKTTAAGAGGELQVSLPLARVRCDAHGRILQVDPRAEALLPDPTTLPLALYEIVRGGRAVDASIDVGDRRLRVLCEPRPGAIHTDIYLLSDELRESGDRRVRLVEAVLSLQESAVLALQETGKVLFSNAAFGRMFQVGEEELKQSEAGALVELLAELCSNPGELTAAFSGTSGAEPGWTTSHLSLTDGRTLAFSRLVLPSDIASSAALWSFRDVTRERRHEDELWTARQAAESADAAKSEFLASMSHEIRTPMTSVLGMSELLLETELDADQQWFARAVHTSASSLIHLINDVIDLAKIEAGHVDLIEEPFELDALIVEQARHAAARTKPGVVVYPNVDPRLPWTLMGDRTRLRQVLTNLISNAVKYTDEGEVEVRVEVRERASGQCELEISVRDSGVGVPASEQERIFEKYAQSRTSARPGTGLGLHICRTLAELMGAELGLSRSDETGSTFFFRLSLPVAEHSDVALETLIEVTSGTQVLLWSDRPPIRRALRALAQGTEMEVIYDPATAVPGRVLVVADVAMEDVVPDVLAGQPVLSVCTPLERAKRLPSHDLLVLPARRLEFLEAIRTARDPEGAEPPLLRVASSSSPTKARQGRGPLHVLLVEDNADNIAVARGLLQRRGHEVSIAHDGKQGIERVKRGGVDVVLMDLAMPGIGGIEAVRRIRTWEAERGVAPVPIIAYSAHATPEMQDRAYEAGCVDFLVKPARSEELLAVLKRATEPRGRVLVVESRGDTRRLFRHYLLQAGYSVATAESAESAHGLLERGEFELLVVGVRPGLDAEQLARFARAQGHSGLILGTTEAIDAATQKALQAAGVDELMVEPVSGSFLVRRVDAHLARDRLTETTVERETPTGTKVPIFTEVDAALEPLIPVFLDNRRQDVQQMRSLIECSDWEGLENCGSALRGMGASYGFDAMTYLGDAIAVAASKKDLTGITASLEQLQSYLERVHVRFA